MGFQIEKSVKWSISLARDSATGLWHIATKDSTKCIKVAFSEGLTPISAVYGPNKPCFPGYGTVNIRNSIAVNALTTGASATIGFWVHQEVGEPAVVYAFLAAFGSYILIASFFYRLIGYGGASISSTRSIVLDTDATRIFCSQAGLAPLGGFICLELDNSLLLPMQRLHTVSHILGFATVD